MNVNIATKDLMKKKTWQTHNKSAHEENKLYEWELCDKRFYGEENLKNHIESAHEEKKLDVCEHCHKRFDEEENLKKS